MMKFVFLQPVCPPWVAPGALVRLAGLRSARFNHHVGRVREVNANNGRVSIELHGAVWPDGTRSSAKKKISVPPTNLRRCRLPEPVAPPAAPKGPVLISTAKQKTKAEEQPNNRGAVPGPAPGPGPADAGPSAALTLLGTVSVQCIADLLGSRLGDACSVVATFLQIEVRV